MHSTALKIEKNAKFFISKYFEFLRRCTARRQKSENLPSCLAEISSIYESICLGKYLVWILISFTKFVGNSRNSFNPKFSSVFWSQHLNVSICFRSCLSCWNTEPKNRKSAEIRRNFGRKFLLGGLPPPQTPPGKTRGAGAPPGPPQSVKKRRPAHVEIPKKTKNEKNRKSVYFSR